MNHAADVARKTRAASLLLCFILLFSMIASVSAVKVSAEPLSDDTGGSRIMVSLGDSYSSGEGIEPFYGQNDAVSQKVQNQDWLAHRSETSPRPSYV